MKPYYQDPDGQITIYHGDCREILPTLAPVDLVLTDPPYNAGMDYGDKTNDKRPVEQYQDWCREWFELLPTDKILIFPGWGNQNFWATINPTSMACWYKPGNPSGGGPFQWTEFEPVYIWHLSFSGSNVFRAPVSNQDAVGTHPCPKPLNLFRQIIKRLRTQGTILDPFMGSGTTLRAAKDLGRKAIGIEIEEKYCEIAARRMSQSVMPL